MIKQDHFNRRCPRLGGPVTFAYCRTIGENATPCGKILDCWWELFDVNALMQDILAPEDYEKLAHYQPPAKVLSILELIEKARRGRHCDSKGEQS